MSPHLILTASLAAAALLGCQTAPTFEKSGFSKPGTSREQFLSDRYQCLREAQQLVSDGALVGGIAATDTKIVTNCQLAASCMAARGYTMSPDGPLVPPPEAVVSCQQ